MKRTSILFILLLTNVSVLVAQKKTLADYDVNWTSPGINSQGSMPLGNGDIGLNAWVEENGDLVFYVSKTDAWNENGVLLKLGKIRVSLYPNVYKSKSFSQKLELEKGRIIVNYGTALIKLWVDANHPVIQVDVQSREHLKARVSFETWRKKRKLVKGEESNWTYNGAGELDANKNFITPFYIEPDTILSNHTNQIISCHSNGYSLWKSNLKLQALDNFANTHTDPLLNRNFGLAIESDGLTNESDTSLISKSQSRNFQINICALTQAGTIASWRNAVFENMASIKKIGSKRRENAHSDWWKEFWNRSYIFVTSKDSVNRRQAETVTQGYILQRFMNACAGRGNSPIKFNGSIFTVDTYNRKGEHRGTDADFRQWGSAYWWQNTRLPYWTMLISGDFDLMEPLFKMYMDALPLRKEATKKYYHHAGAFFPETQYFWGTYKNDDYGLNRNALPDGYTKNPYIRYYWQGGLELSLMMLDYYSFTNDKTFAKNTMVPFVTEILSFFNNHWTRGSDGKILFSPAMSLETFHTAVDPLPEIVGLRKVTEKMLSLSPGLVSENQKKDWRDLVNDLPDIPLRVVNKEAVLAPAFKYSDKANSENPELYAVFPYRAFGIGKPGLDTAKRTFFLRVHKANGGWQQNSIQAAYLGLADEAKKMIVESFSVWDLNFRFPAFWGPNYDWTPDQDHGSVAMNALQRMIIQYEDNQVNLLPAWPKGWDVRFKVNGPDKTTIEGSVENGKVLALKVSPDNKLSKKVLSIIEK